jgi:hypothetical protein
LSWLHTQDRGSYHAGCFILNLCLPVWHNEESLYKSQGQQVLPVSGIIIWQVV